MSPFWWIVAITAAWLAIGCVMAAIVADEDKEILPFIIFGPIIAILFIFLGPMVLLDWGSRKIRTLRRRK